MGTQRGKNVVALDHDHGLTILKRKRRINTIMIM
jgi:hypothetical protein